MKAYLANALILLLCLSGATGQTVDTKSRINGLSKPLNLVNIQGISHRGEKYEILPPRLSKTPTGDQFKSAMAGDKKLDYTITASWDTTINMMKWLKMQYSYDDNGNLSSETGFEGIDSSGWGPNQLIASFKHEHHYNTSLQDTLLVLFKWDQSTRLWDSVYKSYLTYNDYGNVISAYNYDLSENNDPIPIVNKYEYSYNANGNLTSDRIYYFDWTAGQWVSSNKNEYSYDANGNIISRIFYDWDRTIGQWVYNINIEYHYDDYGNNTSTVYYHWEENTSKWVGYNKIEYQYLTNGKKSLETYFDWIHSDSQWVSNSWLQFTYDDDDNITLSKYFSRLDDSQDEWFEEIAIYYYYLDLNPTLVTGLSESKISVYPNPASDYVVFDLPNISESATIELFDIQGKKVLELKLSENKQVSLSNLSKGLYMYKLSNVGIIYKGKLIIE
jgi:hypothetical protein